MSLHHLISASAPGTKDPYKITNIAVAGLGPVATSVLVPASAAHDVIDAGQHLESDVTVGEPIRTVVTGIPRRVTSVAHTWEQPAKNVTAVLSHEVIPWLEG